MRALIGYIRRSDATPGGKRWRNEGAGLPKKEIHLGDCRLRIGPVFRCAAFGDRLAKRARMLAIKGLGDRVADPGSAGVIHDHRCPSHGLQHGPMPSRRGEKSREHQRLAKSEKACWHERRLVKAAAAQGQGQTKFARALVGGVVVVVEAAVPAAWSGAKTSTLGDEAVVQFLIDAAQSQQFAVA